MAPSFSPASTRRGDAVQCWKTAFDVSSSLSSLSSHYQRLVLPSREQASHHLVLGHLRHQEGFLELYDLYQPVHKNNHHHHREILVAVIRLGAHLGGYPQTLHGGATALLMDDVTGVATDVVLAGVTGAVTAQLTTHYVTPVAPLPRTILAQVRLQSYEGRKITTTAQLTNLEQTVVYAQATALYILPTTATTTSSSPRAKL